MLACSRSTQKTLQKHTERDTNEIALSCVYELWGEAKCLVAFHPSTSNNSIGLAVPATGIEGLLPGSVMLCACPRSLFHGSESSPVGDLRGRSTVRSSTFAYAAATSAEDQVGGRVVGIPHSSQGLQGLSGSAQPRKAALSLFHTE